MKEKNVRLEVTPDSPSTEDEHITIAANHLMRLGLGGSSVVKVPEIRMWHITVPWKRSDIAAGVLRVLYGFNAVVK